MCWNWFESFAIFAFSLSLLNNIDLWIIFNDRTISVIAIRVLDTQSSINLYYTTDHRSFVILPHRWIDSIGKIDYISIKPFQSIEPIELFTLLMVNVRIAIGKCHEMNDEQKTFRWSFTFKHFDYIIDNSSSISLIIWCQKYQMALFNGFTSVRLNIATIEVQWSALI